MSDERAGLPSASAVQRYRDCNGSWNQCKGVEEHQTEEVKEWAESGDRIHLWLEDPTFIVLTDPQELEVAELCAGQRTGLVLKVFEENAPFAKSVREDRIWLMAGRKKRFSGKADDTFIYSDTGLIVDFKTGRGDAPESPKNLQLRSLAVILWLKHQKRLRRIYVAIVQPLVNREPLLCCYEEADLEQATAELLALLDAIMKPDAPLTAGTQCKFCPAKFRCPAAKAALETLALNGQEIQDPSLPQLLDLCEVCKPIIKAVVDRAKVLLKENGDAVPGWTLGKPASVRSITDPFAVFKVLSDAALLTRDQFLNDCVSVGVGDLEKAVAKHNQLKPQAAKDTVNATCAEFIQLKPKEPSLEKL